MASQEPASISAQKEAFELSVENRRELNELIVSVKDDFISIYQKIGEMENRLEQLESQQNPTTILTTIPTGES